MPLSPSVATVARVLAQSAVAIAHTGDLLQTTKATVTLPPLGANDAIRVTAVFSHTNSANSKSFIASLGGVAVASFAATTAASTQVVWVVRNRGAANSQVTMSQSGIGSTSVALVATAVDTSTSKSLTLSVQLASAAETVTLEGYTVEHLPG